LTNSQELQNITNTLQNKIYLLGTHRSSWKLAFCFDKGVKSFLNKDQIILEKVSNSDYSRPGEFEVKLNLIMSPDKLKNKVMEYPYWEKGMYYPLQRLIPK
jgi:hypothetical protein